MLFWDDLTEADFDLIYAWPEDRHFRVNLVCDSNGSIIGTDGTSQSLTSRNDRFLLKKIRSGADLVVVGAQSVRDEGWHVPASGAMFVVSSGSKESLPECPARQRVTIGNWQQLELAVSHSRHVLCEGGMSVVSQLLKLGLVDEICLTLAGAAGRPESVRLPDWMVMSSQIDFVLKACSSDHASIFTIWRRG